MDIIYSFLPFWSFDKINMENDKDVFSRIGIEDRNIVNVMGSMILFVMLFVFSQLLYQVLRHFRRYSRHIRKMLKSLTIESAYRTVIILFFLETYLDLTLGGLVNTENDYLLDDYSNWGPRGLITKSDQFALILGNMIYVVTCIFPFLVMFLM